MPYHTSLFLTYCTGCFWLIKFCLCGCGKWYVGSTYDLDLTILLKVTVFVVGRVNKHLFNRGPSKPSTLKELPLNITISRVQVLPRQQVSTILGGGTL